LIVRPIDHSIASVDGREHNDARVREFLQDRDQRVDTVRPRDTHVHQRDVRTLLAERDHRVTGRGRHRHEAHVGLGADDRGEAFPENGGGLPRSGSRSASERRWPCS